MGIRKYLLMAMAAFGLTAGNASAALLLLNTGTPSANFSWSYTSIAGTISGTGTMTASGFNTASLSLLITLNNTSALASNRLTSFGFGIDPNVIDPGPGDGVTFSDAADGGMIGAKADNIPSLALIEVCAFSGPNCSGGGPGGINGLLSDTFTIALNGAWGSQVTIDPVGFKYQTGFGSFEFTTGQGCLPANAQVGFCGVTVPEPSPLALLLVSILSLLSFGYLGMRRARA